MKHLGHSAGPDNRKWTAVSCVVLSCLLILSDGGAVSDFGKVIPTKIGPLTAAGEDASYDRNTLYDYMDGGAEIYLAFDFRGVWARRYAGPGELEVTLDIYDMGSPEEAFGIFSSVREDPDAGIGQDSEYGYGLLRFRQGRYYVTVTANEEDEASGKAVLDVGKEVVKHLGPPGPAPEILACLPEPSLRPDRTSYFHANVSLNNRLFLSSENILQLVRDTDCVLAEYETGGAESAYLLLVRYPDEKRADEAKGTFLAAYLPEAGAEGPARTENGKWALAVQRKAWLSVVLEAPSADWAKELVSSIKFPKT
jgi:hypothetical protein